MAEGGAWVCSGEVLATGRARWGRRATVGGGGPLSLVHLARLPLTCDSESGERGVRWRLITAARGELS